MGLMSLPPMHAAGRALFRRSRQLDTTWTRIKDTGIEVVDPFGDYLPLPTFTERTPKGAVANLPAVWVKKLPVVWVEQRQRKFRIERFPSSPANDILGADERPWYVEETTWGDDRDDYGRMETQADAVALVGFMLKGQRHAATA